MRTSRLVVLLFLTIASEWAIAQQTTEQRVGVLEKRISTLESRLDSLTRPAEGTRTNPKARLSKEPITLRLSNKDFMPSDFMNGRYEDRITLEFEFTNNLTKSIRALRGVVVFQDLFEREILSVTLTIEEDVAPGKMGTWSGGIDYNQFKDEHRRLRSIEQKDLVVKFRSESVIYADGTREKFD